MSCKIIEQTCQHNNNVIGSSGVYVFNVNGDQIKARFTYVIINVNGENKILTHNSAEYEGHEREMEIVLKEANEIILKQK